MKKCNCKSKFCVTCENKRIVSTGVSMILELSKKSINLIKKATYE